MTNIAQGQAVRNDTITDRTHQLREVTVTESRRQHEVKSTAPLRILDHEQMLSLGVTDVADALGQGDSRQSLFVVSVPNIRV